jgi:cytochrome c biogenesis protein CcmG/thiol:disulfide interchange protein DsbE
VTTKANRSRGMPRRTAAVPARSSRTPLIIGAGIVALVIVTAIIAVVLSGGAASGIAEPATTPISVSGNPLPGLTDPASDAAVGQAIPTLTGTNLAGDPVAIGPGDGPTAIVLLAHWCSHCQAEVPLLVDYLAANGMPDGVRIVAISTSIDRARPNYPPSAWLERESWTVPTMTDDANNRALAALGMGSFPGFVFVDGDGRVVQRLTGEIPMTTFDQLVNAIAP